MLTINGQIEPNAHILSRVSVDEFKTELAKNLSEPISVAFAQGIATDLTKLNISDAAVLSDILTIPIGNATRVLFELIAKVTPTELPTLFSRVIDDTTNRPRLIEFLQSINKYGIRFDQILKRYDPDTVVKTTGTIGPDIIDPELHLDTNQYVNLMNFHTYSHDRKISEQYHKFRHIIFDLAKLKPSNETGEAFENYVKQILPTIVEIATFEGAARKSQNLTWIRQLA